MLLPKYDVFDESRYFQPAKTQRAFSFDGENLGITICEDVWNDKNFWAKRLYDRDPVVELIGQGTTVLLNISASAYTMDKGRLRREMLQSIASTHHCRVVYVNQVGGDDSLVFDGGSIAIAASGQVAAQARAFEEDIVLFDTLTGAGDIHPQPSGELEYAYLALVCGTRDYVRKCGFRKVLVGLSGGIDSAVVGGVTVVALGSEQPTGGKMPAPYYSEGSARDACLLANNLGIEFLKIPIADVFRSYRPPLQHSFAGRPADVTPQNPS